MPPSDQSAAECKSLLEECGYSGSRLALNYRLNGLSLPLVGFASKPWDFDSACIAVVDAKGDGKQAVRSCYDLAAPVVWVCRNGSIDWWVQHASNPTLFASRAAREFPDLVRAHKSQLDPASIYRGKTIARIDTARQLDFVDIGLMPLRREEAGKKLGDLVEEMTRTTLRALHQSSPSKAILREVFISVFRLLAGKILKDKGVRGFSSLDLTDPASALVAVAKHYNTTGSVPHVTPAWSTALKPAASLLDDAGSFAVVSPETLAYVYEHTLVTDSLRKKLGIHATPPWLVDYMVWQLYDCIREIPTDDRHVFEPACGHAPFLLATMRMLRMEMQYQTETMVHKYLKNHNHGVEVDDFAREIARLSLTLADIPNSNGWDLRLGDMYETDVLSGLASDCRILLSNPPYEKFEDQDKARYAAAGHPVAHKKAVELLHRTLSALHQDGVFAVIVPQSVVNGPEARALRELLLSEYELAEVCQFPGKVFEFAEMETAVILGRRRRPGFDAQAHRVRLRSVGEDGMTAFRERYAVTSNTTATQARFSANADFTLTVPALDEVWTFLARNAPLSDVAQVGRGIEFKGEKARHGVPAVVDKPRSGYSKGYASVSRDQSIFALPPLRGISTKAELIENERQGMPSHDARLLVNRTRTARNPWRLKVLLDPSGRPVKNNFLVVQPKGHDVSALFLWATLNSPLANAYIARDTMKRDNRERDLANVPVPTASKEQMTDIERLAERYRTVAHRRAQGLQKAQSSRRRHAPLFDGPALPHDVPSAANVRDALVEMDAAVIRLYGLPVRLERNLLDFFHGHERRGVGCIFGDYYPSDFESLVPLHKFISSGYRNSTVDQVAARMKPSESSAGGAALRAAAAAFGGDE
ncbi:MAG: N-6 DNA methylase [Pirellulales bacterium]